jgi:Sulfatase-modifying factor enzyme 1
LLAAAQAAYERQDYIEATNLAHQVEGEPDAASYVDRRKALNVAVREGIERVSKPIAERLLSRIEFVQRGAGQLAISDHSDYHNGFFAGHVTPATSTKSYDAFHIARVVLTPDDVKEYLEKIPTIGTVGQKLVAGRVIWTPDWSAAQVFARWLQRSTGRPIHLPTSVEWLAAVRNDHGKYAWGTESDIVHDWTSACRRAVQAGIELEFRCDSSTGEWLDMGRAGGEVDTDEFEPYDWVIRDNETKGTAAVRLAE